MGRVRLRGVILHGLSYLDAICLTIVFYEQAFPDEMKRQRKWKEMATKLGISIVTDEDLEKARMDRALAVAEAEFLGG